MHMLVTRTQTNMLGDIHNCCQGFLLNSYRTQYIFTLVKQKMVTNIKTCFVFISWCAGLVIFLNGVLKFGFTEYSLRPYLM